MTPVTAFGQITGSICCVVGTLVIALPVPILEMKMKLGASKADNDESSDESDDDDEETKSHHCEKEEEQEV